MPILGSLEKAFLWLSGAAFLWAPLSHSLGANTATVFWDTTDYGRDVLGFLLAVLVTLWISILIKEGRMPRISAALLAPIFLLAGLVWFQAWNRSHAFIPELFVLLPQPEFREGFPRTVHQEGTVVLAGYLSMLGLWLLAIADLARKRIFREVILTLIPICGAVVALIGIAQKTLGVETMLWTDQKVEQTFFAAYRYHANAAAFLNLCWPLALAKLLCVPRLEKNPLRAASWSAVFFLSYPALFVNSSKAGHFLGLVALLLIPFLFWRPLRERFRSARATIAITLILLVSVVSVASIGTVKLVERWEHFLESSKEESGLLGSRQDAYEAAETMISDAGRWGFGAGSFRYVFPFFQRENEALMTTQGDRSAQRSFWRYLHNDYLQTRIEWGIWGLGLWIWLIGGGILLATWRDRSWRRKAENWVMTRGLLLALALVCFHAWVDFPLQIPSIQFYFATLLGVAWRLPKEKRSAGPSRTKKRSYRKDQKSSRMKNRDPANRRTDLGKEGLGLSIS